MSGRCSTFVAYNLKPKSNMYTLGFDIGTSSVKACVLNAETGQVAGLAQWPETEAPLISLQPGWAEQKPEDWWERVVKATQLAIKAAGNVGDQIAAVGIGYQMHGLVCVDEELQAQRPSIIWCDSRAVPYGQQMARQLGRDYCDHHLLGSPAGFTAAKWAWVKDNEPELAAKTKYIMLPGDYAALRLTGKPTTTIPGLSEGMMWDFAEGKPATIAEHTPEIVPTFGNQGTLTAEAAAALGVPAGIPVTYRAGDQPNNAYSLDVMNPGEVAATAGTSGVVYGVTDRLEGDLQNRINAFAHVNYTTEQPRLGLLLCVNGTGILNAWVRRNILPDLSYPQMNDLCDTVAPGADGLVMVPFGNGAERLMGNRDLGCSMHCLRFNTHTKAHMARAAQEGIVFALIRGMEVMGDIKHIRAAKANMFLNPIFTRTLANVTGAEITLLEADGSVGAARGAAEGLGIATPTPAVVGNIQPQDEAARKPYIDAYQRWTEIVDKL